MLVDTHSHLHFAKFDEDRAQVHARMAEFDIKNITVGTAITTSRDAVAYAENHADTWCSVGYHPEHVTSDYEDEDEKGALDEPYDIKTLETLATSSPRVLAIGECGLDYHRLDSMLEATPSSKGDNCTKCDLGDLRSFPHPQNLRPNPRTPHLRHCAKHQSTKSRSFTAQRLWQSFDGKSGRNCSKRRLQKHGCHLRNRSSRILQKSRLSRARYLHGQRIVKQRLSAVLFIRILFWHA